MIPIAICIGIGFVSYYSSGNGQIAESNIISILSIAVSIWIGLNIYNVVNKEDIEDTVEKLHEEYERTASDNLKYNLLKYFDATKDRYEISQFFHEAFEDSEEYSTSLYKKLLEIEKLYVKCVNAYEKGHRDESEGRALQIIDLTRKPSKYKKDILIYCYFLSRKSDALFYKYYRKSIDKVKESISLYDELLDIIHKSREYELDSQSLAYINNTIGYTYKIMADMTKSGDEKEDLLKKAVYYLDKAIKDNPQKARYLQNLGAVYQEIGKLYNGDNKLDNLYLAQEKYERAASAILYDYKSYNNRGSIELEIIDCLLLNFPSTYHLVKTE